MALLLEGYPEHNPILKGIASIAAGADPGQVIADRDAALARAEDFAAAALQATPWLPDSSPLLQYLLRQATAAFAHTDPGKQAHLLDEASRLIAANTSPALQDLHARWRQLASIQ